MQEHCTMDKLTKPKKMLERWRKDCKISPETEIEIIEQVPGTLLLYKCVSCSKHFVDTDWSKEHYKQFRKECATGVDIVWRKDKVEEHWKSQIHKVAARSSSQKLGLFQLRCTCGFCKSLTATKTSSYFQAIVQEMIRTTADVVSEDLGKDLLAAGSWSCALDESEDVRIGASKEIFFFSFRLTLPKENPSETLKGFYISLLPNGPAISNQNCGMKGGVNTIRCLNKFVENNDCFTAYFPPENRFP
eukprot:g23621.t1